MLVKQSKIMAQRVTEPSVQLLLPVFGFQLQCVFAFFDELHNVGVGVMAQFEKAGAV